MSVDNPSPAQEANTMVTETDRNKARSAVVSAYHALDCVTIPFSFLHAFADAAVDAVSTDAEPVIMDDEDRTPMPAGFDDALWRKADEVHHAMALVARDQECVKIIYAALSTHNAEPVKTAPAVAVKDAMTDKEAAGWQSMDSAPKDGKHCLLAIKSSCFVYAIQGAFMSGKWENAAGLESETLCWMPLTRIPLVYLPWTEEFSAASPASKHGDEE